MQIIRELPVILPESLPRIPLRVERLTLAKRRWRGTAEDGAEFGFDLPAPLTNGAIFLAAGGALYVIAQRPEPVLEVTLIPRPAPVARLGWALGNLHFQIEVTDEVVRVPDDPALRQLFAREKIPYAVRTAVFQPFAKAHNHAESNAGPPTSTGVQPPA